MAWESKTVDECKSKKDQTLSTGLVYKYYLWGFCVMARNDNTPCCIAEDRCKNMVINYHMFAWWTEKALSNEKSGFGLVSKLSLVGVLVH